MGRRGTGPKEAKIDQAAQRIGSGKSLVGGGRATGMQVSPTSARELRPAAGAVQGSRLPGGLRGRSQVLRGRCQHGPPSPVRPAPGYCVGQEWEGAGRRRAPLREAGGCLNVPAPHPAPLPQNRFGQSGVREGGWNNESPMPTRGTGGPQADTLNELGGGPASIANRQGTPLLGLPQWEACPGHTAGCGAGKPPDSFMKSLTSLAFPGLLQGLAPQPSSRNTQLWGPEMQVLLKAGHRTSDRTEDTRSSMVTPRKWPVLCCCCLQWLPLPRSPPRF